MDGPDDGDDVPTDDTDEGRRPPRARWRLRALLGLVAVGLVVLLAVLVSDLSGASGTATATGTSSPAPVTTPATTSSASPLRTATPFPTPPIPAEDTGSGDDGGKYTAPAMDAAQQATTQGELRALAARLHSGVTLAAPAAWDRWTGSTPTYDDDIDGCPTISARLGAQLGGRWTYTQGTLPDSGCDWGPVPWLPDEAPTLRFVVSIRFTQVGAPYSVSGDAGSSSIAAMLGQTDYCAGGVHGPRLEVPAVAPGAVLAGCDDDNGVSFDLALPDARGTGVWDIDAWSGTAQTRYRSADALVATLRAAEAVY